MTLEHVKLPKRVLLLGSGALQIGQAGEFDYSGTQAIKALREEGVTTILVNPNIATVQTSDGLADRVYLTAITPGFVARIIERERVDGVLLSFGGQTALNCGLELAERGVFDSHGVRVLGTPIATIRDTEDRKRFVEKLREIGVPTARSLTCTSVREVRAAAQELRLPLMLRSGYSLGGKGSGIVEDAQQLEEVAQRAFAAGVSQVLVEEDLRGWKELEYEVVRDHYDNCIAVCNMENVDPMGIHTGESIVVAPSQTLDNDEYQLLRSTALRVVRHLGVIGECNIQFALDPGSRRYRVIEVNARLSRSSALASKATGYPLAYVAAKIALGHPLTAIRNAVTRSTTALFEPALDYIVCKMPRWDMAKFRGASLRIGSEMKSVGEVMAIGRNFAEVLQKALRMLDIGVDGLDAQAFAFDDVKAELRDATPLRPFAIAKAFADGMSVEEVHKLTSIDPWFLSQFAAIMRMQGEIGTGSLSAPMLRRVKVMGFSDAQVDRYTHSAPGFARNQRSSWGIRPALAKIDTLAAEFPAETNYTYSTYSAASDEAPATAGRPRILFLGSGPYRIGSSVEFDWCCVNSVKTAGALGFETVMLNCNPETVSTDYDECDVLVFDELSFERVLDLCEALQPHGVIVSMGGQGPNSLALRLHRAGVRVLGTSAESIDVAEDRSKFSALLDRLHIDQPRWAHVVDRSEALHRVDILGGFPVLVRPSYVLSGAAMSVAHESNELDRILARAMAVTPEHPVVISKFEVHAREVELDAVADDGELVLWAISEHIEDAGVHSGDATLVFPAQRLYVETMRRIRRIGEALARELRITGPFNVQFLAKDNAVKVIECNLRASRSLPFVSKVSGNNFVTHATSRILGVRGNVANRGSDFDYVGVKAPMFSFSRLMGADPMLGVEMASTGEVACLAQDVHQALLHALLATGFRFPTKGVLLSLGPVADKYQFADDARLIRTGLGLALYATPGTARVLTELGIECIRLNKNSEPPSAVQAITEGRIDMIVNIPVGYDERGRPDGYLIRRCAADRGIPLLTDRMLARAVFAALRHYTSEDELPLAAVDEHVHD